MPTPNMEYPKLTPSQEAALETYVDKNGCSYDDARRTLGFEALVVASHAAMSAEGADEHAQSVVEQGRPDDMPDDPVYGPYIR